METDEELAVRVCAALDRDPHRLLDAVLAVQRERGRVSQEAIDAIAAEVGVPRVDVESVATFYAFVSVPPRGRIAIRLCDDVIDRLAGADRVATVLSQELGIGFGEVTSDGEISLEHTSCIGMSDQAPAALVNDVVITELSTDTARELVRRLRKHRDPRRLVRRLGDGNNAHELVHAMVRNNIRRAGPALLSDYRGGEGLARALAMTPQEVIRAVKVSRLRGRGGAAFPTGIKWELARGAPASRRYVFCNADEGEPGTFKDRVLLTEHADQVLDGMTIAAYAIGADRGILYLRGEYAYLRRFLEHHLATRRGAGLLGRDILGKKEFHFDLRVQLGGGAYICGEETALLSSVEGGRGDPKTRPPFPAQHGYLGCPTVVNNVETLACVARILERGAAWFSQFGTRNSTGTKLLSVSGDCASPGVYEVPLGVPLRQLLDQAGAYEPGAIAVGGASGTIVGADELERRIAFDDLSTGGAVMVFGRSRNVVMIVRELARFFAHESCGYCTPCRVGTPIMVRLLDLILAGKGKESHLAELADLGLTMRATSRCGLGQTAANPVLSTLERFAPAYRALIVARPGRRQPDFDLRAALADGEMAAGRRALRIEEDDR